MVKLKKRILILIAAHVVGLTGFRYWQANDYEFFPPTPEERAAALGQSQWGLIRVPVANLNADNRFSASVVTQALMGMPIRLLQKNGWYEVQLPDGYTGWLHASQFVRMTEEALGQWNAREHLIVTSLNAPVTSVNDETIVTTLVAGARVAKIRESESVYVVELPDGRQGEIAKESVAEMAVFQEVERVRRTGGFWNSSPSNSRAAFGSELSMGWNECTGHGLFGFYQNGVCPARYDFAS